MTLQSSVGFGASRAVVMKSSVFWDMTLTHTTLKMEAICCSETSTAFERATQSYIPFWRSSVRV
jgi:hypothetical protein